MSVFCKKKFNDEGDLSRITKDDHNDNDKNQFENKNLILRKTRAACTRSKEKHVDDKMIISKSSKYKKLPSFCIQ